MPRTLLPLFLLAAAACGREAPASEPAPEPAPAWAFDDAPNTAVFTTVHVLEMGAWIQTVSHELEDGAWQFIPLVDELREDDARVVELRAMVDLDPEVAALHDLPVGWRAWRTSRKAPWQRAPIEEAGFDLGYGLGYDDE